MKAMYVALFVIAALFIGGSFLYFQTMSKSAALQLREQTGDSPAGGPLMP
jgi:hypothetical protein